jgi:hypothetical protein
MKVIVLSKKQSRLIQNALKLMPAECRDDFTQKVTAHLTENPSDEAVLAAVNAQMDLLVDQNWVPYK